jgi:hypothetical protein
MNHIVILMLNRVKTFAYGLQAEGFPDCVRITDRREVIPVDLICAFTSGSNRRLTQNRANPRLSGVTSVFLRWIE